MSIALGTYVVFARSLQSPAKNTENKLNISVARRHVGLVVDVYNHPNTSTVELTVQTVSRARAPAPAHLPFAIPIAGPAECSTGADPSSDGEASILRVEPEGQPFPWDGCVQWMTRGHAALLRVVLQHDDHTNHPGSGARCRLTSASLLNFAEVAEEACEQEIHKEAELDDIEAVPVEIWFDLGLADVDKNMLE